MKSEVGFAIMLLGIALSNGIFVIKKLAIAFFIGVV